MKQTTSNADIGEWIRTCKIVATRLGIHDKWTYQDYRRYFEETFRVEYELKSGGLVLSVGEWGGADSRQILYIKGVDIIINETDGFDHLLDHMRSLVLLDLMVDDDE